MGWQFHINELNLIKENNLSTKSFIHINGDDAQLISLYQNARAFIFPSIYEGQGLPQLEAMSFECPVISSNQEAIVEATGNSAILFDPLDTDDILDKIQKTIYSEEIINSLRIKSLERSKLFSMDSAIKKPQSISKNYLINLMFSRNVSFHNFTNSFPSANASKSLFFNALNACATKGLFY